MAVAIICGLLIATILTLGVVPTLTLAYYKFRDRKKNLVEDEL
jgi:multidrug efflux pump subunit AcrB